MNETFAFLVALITLLAILVPLARTLAGGGVGVCLPPRRAGDQRRPWTMPHDEPRKTRQ